MAFWNAPLDDPDHALNACRSALGMLDCVDRLNREWAAEAGAEGRVHVPVRIGIGINTAMCCVGNLGSEHRFDYSVVGDGVNVASRLEGRSKSYGVPIVVGEATAAVIPQLGLLEVDFVSVHGRSEALHVFGLLGEEGWAADSANRELLSRHAAMLMAFRSRRFDEAAALLVEARAAAGSKLAYLYDYYEGRIAEYKINPPSPDWDGRSMAETK